MITYPLELPGGFRTARLRERNAVGKTESPRTYGSQVFRWSGQGWLLDVEYPAKVGHADAKAIQATISSLEGGARLFLAGPPDYESPVPLGTPVIDASSPSGQNLPTRGWPASTAVLSAGDYIQVGQGSTARLYRVLADVVSDGGGLASIPLWPRFRGGNASGSPVEHVTDGGFENATADDFDSYDEVETGGLVTRSTSVFNAGSSSVQLNRTAASGPVDVAQQISGLDPGCAYILSCDLIGNNVSAEAQVYLSYNPGGDFWYLDSAGVWQSNTVTPAIDVAPGTSWATFTRSFQLPTTFPTGNTLRLTVRNSTSNSIGDIINADTLSISGPDFDGADVITQNPKGAFRLIPGQVVGSEVNYGSVYKGLAFRAEEAL